MVPRPDPRLRGMTGPMGWRPISTLSRQGTATTGRYAESPGAIRIFQPYAPTIQADDSALTVAPSESPARMTPEPTDSAVQTPVSPHSLQVDPEIDTAIRDTSVDMAKNVGMRAGVPLAAGVAAGYPLGMVAPAAIGASLAGTPAVAALSLGMRAVNEGVPGVYAKVRDMLNQRGYNSAAVDAYRDTQGNLNPASMPDDLANDAAASIADRMTRSQPLTSYPAQAARSALGYLDDNVVQPARSFFGFTDEAEQSQPAKGIDDDALGAAANTPDFALSGYDAELQANEEREMAKMREDEQARRAEERAAAMAKAEALADKITRGQFGGYGAGAGFGSGSHTSSGNAGGLVGRDSQGNLGKGKGQNDSAGGVGGGLGGTRGRGW